MQPRWRLNALLGPAGICWLLCGCRVALVSDYDPTTDGWVTELQQTIDAHLSTLEVLSALPKSSPSLAQQCHPDQFKDTYRNIDARMRSLILRNEVRVENTLTTEQLRLLQSSLGKLKEQQAARYSEVTAEPGDRCLDSRQVNVNRELLEQNIRAVLKLELSKRDLRNGD
jgi:hypothetical protein